MKLYISSHTITHSASKLRENPTLVRWMWRNVLMLTAVMTAAIKQEMT
jgi:hypothetical protein